MPILFDHVERVVRSLFARLHRIQCVIYKRYMDHAHKVIDFSTIHENIIDDYYQHIAHIPHIMNTLDLFQIFPPSEFNAPIPPPKHPNDDNSESIDGNTGSTTIPHPDIQHGHEAIGLGITPTAVVADVDGSSQCLDAIALEDYESQGVGDISFHKNQQIDILSNTDQNQDGWLTAKISGEIGLVPSEKIKILEQSRVR